MSTHYYDFPLIMLKNMGFKENLKSELAYSGMLVKELALKSGVKKYSIDNYLNKRGQAPSVETAVKIAQALGVSVEYLVTGKESTQTAELRLSNEAYTLARYAEQLNDKDRKFAIDFIQWIKSREGKG
jgi:transcriptional regulator with XRE-family HTH domain